MGFLGPWCNVGVVLSEWRRRGKGRRWRRRRQGRRGSRRRDDGGSQRRQSRRRREAMEPVRCQEEGRVAAAAGGEAGSVAEARGN